MTKLRPVVDGSIPPAIQLITPVVTDFSMLPEFTNPEGEREVMRGVWPFGWFQDGPDDPPIHFQQSFRAGKGAGGGYLKLGEGVLSKQDVLYEFNDRMYARGTEFTFACVEGDPEGRTDDPVTYEVRSADGATTFRFSSKYSRFIDGDFVDLTYEHMPYAGLLDRFGPMNLTWLNTQARVTGRLGDREVDGWGGLDRVFGRPRQYDEMMDDPWALVQFGGVLGDGTREWGLMLHGMRNTYAYYCKDGEEPVWSTDAVWEGTFEDLPYVDDGTQALTSATCSFAGKTIHYEGRWGFRGHNGDQLFVDPTVEPGKSHAGGIWWEGGEQYSHRTPMVYVECHQAFEGRM